MDSGGRLERRNQVDADGTPPVIHRARMMVREASGRCRASIWVVSQKHIGFCPIGGTKAVFFILAAPARSTSAAQNTHIWRNQTMKKHNLIQKLSALAAALALALAACSAGRLRSAAAAPADHAVHRRGERYKVAIIKQLDHASLDEIANAVAARLDEASPPRRASPSNTRSAPARTTRPSSSRSGDQAIADEVDAIIPIATTAAQVAARLPPRSSQHPGRLSPPSPTPRPPTSPASTTSPAPATP